MGIHHGEDRRMVGVGIPGASLDFNELGLTVGIQPEMDDRHPLDRTRTLRRPVQVDLPMKHPVQHFPISMSAPLQETVTCNDQYHEPSR